MKDSLIYAKRCLEDRCLGTGLDSGNRRRETEAALCLAAQGIQGLSAGLHQEVWQLWASQVGGHGVESKRGRPATVQAEVLPEA